MATRLRRSTRLAWRAVWHCLCAAVLTGAGVARAADVRVAVAANFAAPAAELAEGFRAATGHRVKLSIGPTGALYSQVLAGAPFDVLLAADTETPRRLLEAGHAVAGSATTYAVGRLVLWSAQPDLATDPDAALRSPRVTRVALANPRVAPYGAAAMQVLRARGWLAAVEPRLVRGDSIAQTFQFVATGNAEVGFIALSQLSGASAPRGGSRWLVPQALHDPIRQDAVLLSAGRNHAGAQAWMAYLSSAPARARIAAYGYGLPER